MKKIILTSLLFPILTLTGLSQTYLAKQWDHTYGGIYVETLTSLSQTADSGFILGGYTNSDSSGEISEQTRGGYDYWIVKTDSTGNMQWEKRFGGSLSEKLFSVEQTLDGGYILAGFAASDSGFDISQPSKGGLDFWAVKTDASGIKQWDKRYGGIDSEWLSSVVQTADSGFMFGGWTFSDSSGDVSQNSRGGSDFWILKTDKNGTRLWDKKYGGNSSDELYVVRQTTDLGYILGGTTSSDSSFEVTSNSKGNKDFWIVRTDVNGVKLWDKRFGGSDNDNLLSMELTMNGGYILGGYTISDSSGDVSQVTRDTSLNILDRGDAWIVKVDSLGSKQWDKRFGGEWVEDAFGYVTPTRDGGYLMGCASYSNISGDKTENNFGFEQSWLVKMDSAGTKLWDKTIFVGREDEYAYPIETYDGCYAIANWSEGGIGAYKSEDRRGAYDFWMIKFCETNIPQLPAADFTASYTEICQGGCFDFTNFSVNSSSFTWNFPGSSTPTSTVTSPTQICYSDTGHYTVTLIASNAGLSDTLEFVNLLYVVPLPPANITQIGDSLFVQQGYLTYQWYYNGAILLNDTNYFLLALQDGDYRVDVVDTFGCPNNDTIFSVQVGLKEFTINGFSIGVYPNPAKSELSVEGLEAFVGGSIQIVDLLGKEIYSSKIINRKKEIQLSNINPGIYFIEVRKGNSNSFARFIKE